MPTSKRTEKLAPVPRPRRPQTRKGGATDAPPAAPVPDLSRIAEDLRPLAVPLAELQFHPRNAISHNEANLEGLRASLRVNGQYKPILASSRTTPPTIVAGNGLMQAALLEGWTHLACMARPLTEREENEILIVDNLTGADPQWDAAHLDALLRDLHTGGDPKLEAMLAELAAATGVVPADPPAPAGEPAPASPKPRLTCPECGHTWEPA